MNVVKLEEIKSHILALRGESVLLDSQKMSEDYGIATKEVKQAVSNNPEEFISGYIIELTEEKKQGVAKNFDHLVKLKFSPHLPKNFTEKDLHVLAITREQ